MSLDANRLSTGKARHQFTGEVPVSGAWFECDHPGERKFQNLGDLRLESGQIIPSVRLAYETWGTLSPNRDNVVLVLHALTGDSHVTGEAGPGHTSAGWWVDMVGPGAPIDTDKYFVIAPNVLGGCQGSTGPASLHDDGARYGSRFPRLTVRDQVTAEVRLLDFLGIGNIKLIIGASMGGHRVLEWAISQSERVERIAVIASAASTSADQLAWAHTQLAAIRLDPGFADGDYYDRPAGAGPHRGLGIARQIAHTTYRSAAELDTRFARIPQRAEEPLQGGRFAVQSYLDHQANKLVHRFDANSYVILTESMLTHDVGRDRGGVAHALRKITARTLVIAVDSDRLFPLEQSQEIVGAVRSAEPLHVLHSDHGHDGFLLEFDQIGPVIDKFLSARVLPELPEL